MKTKKLELKHLAAYLPYNVRCDVNSLLFPNPLLTGINGIFAYLNYYGGNLSFEYEKIKPILRPISDLTKEIEVNRVKVIPIIELAKIEAGEMFRNIIESPIYDESENQITVFYYDECGENTLLIDFDSTSLFTCCRGSWTDSARNQYELFQKLFEMHFDVFGLIPLNLAIDINTLNK